MKNILIPTDFSSCAIHAMNLGVALAEFFGADLHLLTSMDNNPNGETLENKLVKNSPEGRQFMESSNLLFEQWREEAKVRNVELKTICTSGKLLPALEKYVAENNIDFVVMGSHGSSGMSEYFIGSNTQKVVRHLHVPVFVIKHPLKQYEFKHVIFASNFHEEEKESYLEFLDFIQKFKPETIHLLAINTVGWFGKTFLEMEHAMEDFKLLCPFSKCQSHVIKDTDVETGIRNFAEKIEADLVAISNHNRHPLKRVFSGSNVEALVNHCELPVLSIDFIKKENLVS